MNLYLDYRATIFVVLKFQVTGANPLKITGRRTCYFVLLTHPL